MSQAPDPDTINEGLLDYATREDVIHSIEVDGLRTDYYRALAARVFGVRYEDVTDGQWRRVQSPFYRHHDFYWPTRNGPGFTTPNFEAEFGVDPNMGYNDGDNNDE